MKRLCTKYFSLQIRHDFRRSEGAREANYKSCYRDLLYKCLYLRLTKWNLSTRNLKRST